MSLVPTRVAKINTLLCASSLMLSFTATTAWGAWGLGHHTYMNEELNVKHCACDKLYQ